MSSLSKSITPLLFNTLALNCGSPRTLSAWRAFPDLSIQVVILVVEVSAVPSPLWSLPSIHIIIPVTVLGENGAPTWKDTPPLDSIFVLSVTAVGETSVAPVTLIVGVPVVTKLLLYPRMMNHHCWQL